MGDNNEWLYVSLYLPKTERYVMTAAPSGVSPISWRYSEARYEQTTGDWRDCQNNCITDNGLDVLWWKELDEALPLKNPIKPLEYI